MDLLGFSFGSLVTGGYERLLKQVQSVVPAQVVVTCYVSHHRDAVMREMSVVEASGQFFLSAKLSPS